MKIFHMGDWHIGKSVNGFDMTEDQQFVMEQLYDKIKMEKPQVLLIAGDLYDRSVPPVQAIDLLNKVLEKIVIQLNTPVIAIAGNHDSNERINFGSELLKESGLYIIGNLKKEIQKIRINDEYGPVYFYPIPYSDPPIVRDLFKDESIKNHDDAMKKIVTALSQNIDKDKRNVAIAHGYVTYMKNTEDGLVKLEESDSEKPLSIGGTALINASCFNPFNYTALGHLHRKQKVGSDNIRYSGSLLKYSFSETEQKGITIVDLDDKGKIKISFSEFKPKRDFRIIKGELKELIKDDATSIDNKEDYVKVILTDKGELIDPMAKIRSVYPNAMELYREDKERSSSINKSFSQNIREKSEISLFESFYEKIIGEKCSEEDIKLMNKIIEKADKGVIEQ